MRSANLLVHQLKGSFKTQQSWRILSSERGEEGPGGGGGWKKGGNCKARMEKRGKCGEEGGRKEGRWHFTSYSIEGKRRGEEEEEEKEESSSSSSSCVMTRERRS